MRKSVIVLCLALAGVGGARGEEGRWSLSMEKSTGQEVARLQADGKKVLKVLPLENARTYSPVPYEDVLDKKRRAKAKRRGFKFTRLKALHSSATVVDGGRLLIFQEQTIVMPPEPEMPAGNPPEEKDVDRREPEENSILVTVYDGFGKALWSRKFGPLAGRLPVQRKAWSFPGLPEPPVKEDPAADPPKK